MKKLFFVTTLAVSAASVHAQESAFQASLTPDIAIHSRSRQINGLTLSIWGENPQQSLALGIVNGSTGKSSGLSWGLFNYSDSYDGVAWGFANLSRENFYGWQNGVINYSAGTFTGLQSGAFNFAQECHGLQFGLVNYSEHLRGVQLGFINVAMNNPWFTEFPDKLATGFPLLNWSF